jgi:hypothetical protein
VNDLTDAQAEELAGILQDFVQDRALDGLHCVVVVVGRGISKTAYAKDTAPVVPTLLAAAYRASRDYNVARQN